MKNVPTALLFFSLFLASFNLLGCASARPVNDSNIPQERRQELIESSATEIDCPVDDLVVSGINGRKGMNINWRAECADKAYQCSESRGETSCLTMMQPSKEESTDTPAESTDTPE